MRRALALTALGVALLALALSACGGDDDEDTTTAPAPTEAPTGSATPPSPGALPPELAECFADQGFEIESPADIHSAPQPVVEECFGRLHRGGGAP